MQPAQWKDLSISSALQFRRQYGHIRKDFEEGKNALSLEAVNEPLVLKSLCVWGQDQGIKYREYAREDAQGQWIW